MSENDNKKAPYNRPDQQGTNKPYGRPAAGQPQPAQRHYGKPAGAPQGQGGEGRGFGSKPAFDRGPQSGERKPFARPAGAPQGQGGGRSFGSKPAFDRGPQSGERKPFARPAGAPQGQGGEGRGYARPAFDRGAPRPQEGGNRFNKPSFVPDPQGNDRDRRSFSRPAQSQQPQQRFGRPGFSGPARPAGAFHRPASPRPSFNHAAPGRTDFRSQPNDREGTGLSADARKSAMLVLNRVLLESGFASLSLDEHFEKVNLSQKDKRLCTRIVYLTLEHLNQIDFALDRYLEDTEKLEKRVRNILRLSAAQILLLDRIPDSAAVNEAVKLTRDLGLEDLTGLVNGVLRNLIRGREELSFPAKEEGLTYYRVMQSLPEWYAQKILDAYGPEEGDRLLCYEKQEHYITVRPNLQRISAVKFEELLRKKTWDAKPGILPGVWHISGASDIGHDNDFLDGLFSIQGEGSMVAAMAVKPKLGAQVLDTCAAPGGKSAFMSEQMQGTGRVQAWDVHEHRVDLIQALADRLRLYNIRPAMRDALVYREQMDRMMDAVLIDAPCTGSGMLFEKPDLRHNLKEESLKELTEIQSKLLDTCSHYVKPGAALVYATCSILPEENHLQVKDFLDTHPDFVMDALPEEIPANLRELTGEYGLQLLPHRDGMEGFFVARMKRV